MVPRPLRYYPKLPAIRSAPPAPTWFRARKACCEYQADPESSPLALPASL